LASLDEYLQDPCGTLSIPYWKAARTPIPDQVRIVHADEFEAAHWTGYSDTRYFRLIHPLVSIPSGVLDDRFEIRTANPCTDAGVISSLIDASYDDIRVTPGQVLDWAGHPVFDGRLWVLVAERSSGTVVGAGIAELDRSLREGVLEWIQVLPAFRRRGLGQFIVTELLSRLVGIAGFDGIRAGRRPVSARTSVSHLRLCRRRHLAHSAQAPMSPPKPSVGNRIPRIHTRLALLSRGCYELSVESRP